VAFNPPAQKSHRLATDFPLIAFAHGLFDDPVSELSFDQNSRTLGTEQFVGVVLALADAGTVLLDAVLHIGGFLPEGRAAF
jgi:hypothetical protein